MLVMGVVDIPYTGPDILPPKKVAKAKKGKANKPLKPKKPAKGPATPMTTGEVAEILEDHYHVMENYVVDAMPYIQKCMIQSLEGAIVNLNLGAPVIEGVGPFEEAAELIGQNFKDFLTLSVIEHMGVDGVPTRAALEGVNHRLKSGKGGRRPSFIDSGQYQASSKAWVE